MPTDELSYESVFGGQTSAPAATAELKYEDVFGSPSKELSHEEVFGSGTKSPELDKAVAQTARIAARKARDARLQQLNVDTQPPEASYKSTPFGEGLGSGIIQGVKGMIPSSIGQAAIQAASMATPLVDAYRGIARPFQQGKPSTLQAKPFTEFTPEDWGKFTAEMGIDAAQAAMIAAGLKVKGEGIPNASKVGSATEVPVREVRGEVGQEAPLQQQGQTAGKETTIPPQAETVLAQDRFGYKYVKRNGIWWNVDEQGNLLKSLDPQDPNHVSVIEYLERGGEVNEAQKTRSQTVESNQPQGTVPQHGVEQEPVSEGQPQDGGQSSGKLRDEVSDVKGEGEQTPPPAPTHDEPVMSAIANKYTQERSRRGDLGVIEPNRGTSASELATRGQKIVEQQGEGVVDQAVSRVMSGTFDPVNDASVVRFQEARLRVKKDIAYRELQKQPQNPALQINYDNAFKDLTDFHKGPIAQVKGNWHLAGKGLQGNFPVDVSTADGIREAWLQGTGEDAPAGVKPTIQKVADRVKRSIDAENGQKSRLYDQIEQDFAKSKQKSHEAIRDRFMKELENRPCK